MISSLHPLSYHILYFFFLGNCTILCHLRAGRLVTSGLRDKVETADRKEIVSCTSLIEMLAIRQSEQFNQWKHFLQLYDVTYSVCIEAPHGTKWKSR
jgi:hypothetical protein